MSSIESRPWYPPNIPQTTRRCTDADADAGYCQLLLGHSLPHAAVTDDAVLQWSRDTVSRWPRTFTPAWLLGRPWSPGLGPLR